MKHVLFIHSASEQLQAAIHHQICWREQLRKLNTITKTQGQHEFHQDIEELLPIIER
ncbi:hypothetical protein [Macrococcus carouselicus]|uniref:hypothetical protein n=1 Tax=Macrococcus carouselicus TaxID=69969 RepID=UPI001408F3B8|nr:hypothetical protein [Macrococcus carouselicus]